MTRPTRTEFSVVVDPGQVSDAMALFEFVGGNSRDAIRIAINKAGRRIKSSTAMAGGGASQRIREQVNFKVSYINEHLNFEPANRGSLIGKVTTPSRGALLSVFATNLNSFSTAQPKVKVKPSGAAKSVFGDASTYPNKPFFMVLRNSGVVGIVARRNRPGANGGKIKAFYGPSLSQVFKTVKDDMATPAANEYQAQLLDAMRFLLTKRYPPES